MGIISNIDKEFEIKGCLSWYAINHNCEKTGNTWLKDNGLFEPIRPLIVSNGNGLISATYGRMERRCAWVLNKYINMDNSIPREYVEKGIHKAQQDSRVYLGDNQIIAIHGACSHNVSNVVGGPGTGKTTIAKTITGIHKRVIGCSPTGQGASVLSKSIGVNCYTVQRLSNQVNEGFIDIRPLDLIIADESGMMSIDFLDEFLSCIYNNGFRGRLVFMGDSGQLPSVGPGKVLSDLCECIPTYELDISFRFSDYHIGQACIMAKQGKVYSPARESSNYRLFSDRGTVKLWSEYKKLVNKFGINNVRMITYHTIDAWKFNKMAIDSYPNEPPIVCLRNNYEEDVFNGQTGNLVNGRLVFGGRRIDPKRLYWTYAFASTCHKAQGGQWPAILVWIPNSRYITKEWLNTALSRTQEELVLVVADEHNLEMSMHKNKTSDKRITLLSGYVTGAEKWES